MKKHIVAVAALCLLGSGAALAQDFKAGNLLVRARAVHLDSANKDSTGLDLAVNDKWLPEVDFTYFMSSNLAAELILTVPQKHRLTAGGAPIGSLKHLPPTLTVQYHFTDLGAF
ncbi:MAG: OmpW family protein, partial [Hydrogenophaga sp.]|nr:OmpW family protein [Hydrogenophaga sp.]